MKGFLVICNNNEKGVVRDVYNILNEYADKLYGFEKVVDSVFINVCYENNNYKFKMNLYQVYYNIILNLYYYIVFCFEFMFIVK